MNKTKDFLEGGPPEFPLFISYIMIIFSQHDIINRGSSTEFFCILEALKANLAHQFLWFFSCFSGCTRGRNNKFNSLTFNDFYFLIYPIWANWYNTWATIRLKIVKLNESIKEFNLYFLIYCLLNDAYLHTKDETVQV